MAASTRASALDEKAIGEMKQSPSATATDYVTGTAWAEPGQAAYNFFSDTATTATPSMLNAILRTTLLDDVFEEDPTTNSLEKYVASLFGYPSALLVMSGTMGNQLALRSHLASPPYSVVSDHRAHIAEYEAGGLATLTGAMLYSVVPSNGRYVTLDDVKARTVLSTDVHKCPTKVISLENTIGGTVIPVEECKAIADWAHEHDIIMHLDGARIWEAVASQVADGHHEKDFAKGLKAYASCFDSIQTCFSKGLGAPMGSILMGKPEFIKKARHHRKAIGGGMRATGIIAAPARVAVDETFLGGKLAATHILARRVAEMWEGRGGKLQRPVETNMVWLDFATSSVSAEAWIKAAEAEGVKAGPGRIVCHYQLCEDAVQKLDKVMAAVLTKDRETNGHNETDIYKRTWSPTHELK